jgi:periplasmic protein CpxP/Spy
MSRIKLLNIAVIGLLLINVGTLTFIFLSNHGSKGMGHHPPRHSEEGPKKVIIERLGFDEAQQNAYDVIIMEHREKRREFNQRNHHLHDNLFALLKTPELNVAVKDSLMTEIARNQKNMDELNFSHFQKIRSLCKEDQVKKFDALVDDLGDLFRSGGPAR